MFEERSLQLERIDTGDYTPAEYERFLREIRLVNRYIGDNRALRKTLLRRIEREDIRSFSVLDVGAGSGELLRTIADFARRQKREAQLFGLELNAVSAAAIRRESNNYDEIRAIRGNALQLPFDDGAFDFVICSLFTHHFTDENIIIILREFSRVARLGIFVIDLHRHPVAYQLYKLFCFALNISPLVRDDGLLSILRAFKPAELERLAQQSQMANARVERCFPFRLILKSR